MSEPGRSEDQIFAMALSLPAGERRRFIEEACRGDAALMARIEELLRADDSVRRFISTPSNPGDLLAGLRPAAATSEAEGDMIGRYKLLQRLGEGGCGVVWMAEQEEPVRRRVALKIIKLGMDTKVVIARFEAERQALAMLDHPNIAKILDAGATEAGRPFFVMELVRGVKITDFCDQYNQSTEQRLGLFSQVCNAVQHAHQKGIIHRDLKPSNIMVALNDGVPVPKVIDFGIAKAIEGRLTDHTLFTAFEQFIGTPAYMSPEQAELSGLDIDTRSDIYSLGVLLYELLTGRPPFDPKTLRQAGLDEIRRIIREVEPPRPSTNLSTLADADRTEVARLRDTDPAKLSLLLRGDLDWIVMRCLEKNRTRRYETPSALAADIARHLHHEPVVARPPSRAYRFGRLVRRNRLAFAAIASVAVALLVGSIVSTWQAVRARQAERQADLERGRAEDLLRFMLGDLYTQLNKVGRLDVLEAVADKAEAYFTALSAADFSDSTRFSRARALRLLGGVRMSQARYAEAAAAFSAAYARASDLALRHPRDGDMLLERGKDEFELGFVHWQRDEYGDAGVWLTRYRDTCLALVALDPSRADWRRELIESQHNLAGILQQQGNFAAARAAFTGELATLGAMIAADPSNLDLRKTDEDVHSRLGTMADKEGELPEALRQYSLQAAQLQFICQADPKTTYWQQYAGVTFLYKDTIDAATGRYAAAEEDLRQARKILGSLVALDPSNASWKCVYLTAELWVAVMERHDGDLAEATLKLNEIFPQIEALAEKEPTDPAFAALLMHACRVNSQLQFAAGRPNALLYATRATEIGERLSHGNGVDPADVGECATAYVISGEIAAKSGDPSGSRRDWRRAEQLLAPLAPASRDWRLLDPAARTAILLGHPEHGRALIAKLTLLGYVPLDPWPEPDRHDAAKIQDNISHKESSK